MGPLRQAWLLAVAAACHTGIASAPCTIECSAGGSCPTGLVCSADGYCHGADDGTDCSPPEISLSDAAPSNAPGECGVCDHPPERACVDECQSATYQPMGTCVDGTCAYEEREALPCPHGCDPATGRCRTPAEACPGTTCGTSSACGGVCGAGSGCCASTAERCDNAVDDDCDGLVDCLDPECVSVDPRCCSGSGLVYVVPDSCINDGGTAQGGDSLEIYCCDGLARFCLTNESCAWRGGGCPDTTATCSRSGLADDWMASAGCNYWHDIGAYFCDGTWQVYFH